MNKLIKEALKDLETIKVTIPTTYAGAVEYWLRRAYLRGRIDQLKKIIKNK